LNALHKQSLEELGKGSMVSARDKHGIIQTIESRVMLFESACNDIRSYFCIRGPTAPVSAFVQAAKLIPRGAMRRAAGSHGH
jgi:hypothetical protein